MGRDYSSSSLFIPPPPPPGQNDRLFADDMFRSICLKENFCILIPISLKCVPKVKLSKPNNDLDNSLVPNRRQDIFWTNADPIYWRIYATLVGVEVGLGFVKCDLGTLPRDL